MDEKDLFIKQKLQKDQLISKKADDVFNNFLKGDFNMEKGKNEKKEEKSVETKKKPMMKRLLATAASLVIVFGMANVYATTQGYGNVFFMIKYLVTGQNETITDKDDILSDRDISISYEPVRLTENIRMQIRNLQVKDNKAKLIIAVNEAEEEDSSVVPLNYKVYNLYNELLCEQKSGKEKGVVEYKDELTLNNFKENDNVLILEVYKTNNNKMAKITIDLKSRNITVEGEAEALKKVSEIELKKYLGVVSEYNGEPKGDEGKIKYAQAIFNEIKGESENNIDEINNMLESLEIEKVSDSFTQGDDYKKVTKNGKSYYEVINGWDEYPYTVLDITDMSYCDGLYTATFTYIMMSEEGSFDEDYSNIEKYEATVYFRVNDDDKYSKFKFVKYEEEEKSEANSDIKDDKIEIPSSNNYITIGTTLDTFKSYEKIDNCLSDNGLSSGGYYDIIKTVNGLGYYLNFNFNNDNKISAIGVDCTETKDGIGTGDSSFNEVKDFYKDFKNVDILQEEGLIIVNINDEFNNISIKHEFTNNKLKNITLYLNAMDYNKDGTEIDETKVKNAFQDYLDLIAAQEASPNEMLMELNLIKDSNNGTAKERGFAKTNVKYSEFKKKMLNYVTEKCYQNDFRDCYIEEDGYLCYMNVGATGIGYEVKSIENDGAVWNVYRAEVLWTQEEAEENTSFDFMIEYNNDGKIVIDYAKQN